MLFDAIADRYTFKSGCEIELIPFSGIVWYDVTIKTAMRPARH
jgi:hypothetical protein